MASLLSPLLAGTLTRALIRSSLTVTAVAIATVPTLTLVLWPTQFNSGWPISLTTATGDSILNSISSNLNLTAGPGGAGVGSVAQITQAFSQYVGATGTDQQYVDGLKALTTDNGAPTYMGAVSPWFFTHYGANTYNKNVRYRLYLSRVPHVR